jgi:hypothetical protein
VPALLGERRPVERAPLDGDPIAHAARANGLDPQSRVLHRFGEVATQRLPRLADAPAGVGQQLAEQRVPRRLDRRLAGE